MSERGMQHVAGSKLKVPNLESQPATTDQRPPTNPEALSPEPRSLVPNL